MKSQYKERLKKEISRMIKDPDEEVWQKDESISLLEAQITGPEDTVYENGIFKLQITVPEQYPNRPLIVKFITPIFHPNIDEGGRICADILKLAPEGSWTPRINISTCLKMIRQLMINPNPDDGLMPAISDLYKSDYESFKRRATEYTNKHAISNPSV